MRHAGDAPALVVWKTTVLAVTPMTRMEMVAGPGIAPRSSALQAAALTDSAIQREWSLRAVARRGLSVIGRLLCF